jgi:dihydroorotate dehydrogenase electron transfer subunit
MRNPNQLRTEQMIRSVKIQKKNWYSKNIFGFECNLSGIVPLPGQFFQIRVSENMDPFLNRPISVASYIRNRLLLIIKVVGRGTRILSEKKQGEHITLLGPFGNGIKPKRKNSLLLAGGIGVAPLYFLAETLNKNRIPFTFLYGAKDYNDFILNQNIKKLADKTIFITEHGKKNRGTVVSTIKKINLSEYEVAYTCGPKQMLIELQKLNLKIPIYALCEDFLGCGCGLCLGCAISYNGEYKRICEDGPVFELQGVDFEV